MVRWFHPAIRPVPQPGEFYGKAEHDKLLGVVFEVPHTQFSQAYLDRLASAELKNTSGYHYKKPLTFNKSHDTMSTQDKEQS